MSQEILDWIHLFARWLHITVAVTWIGTSIFFMWLDRSFEPNPKSQRPGHVGELWMVHGGGFYHVEKLLMGPTKAPDRLHWFKWESYWTWMSGMFLVVLIYYLGEGTFLLDSMVSDINFTQGLMLGLFSIFGSWFFYDFTWENSLTKKNAMFGHALTLGWFFGMSYLLCHTLSGRAAYVHVGAMLGTWMTANVFMRIIPRQIKMVEASSKGEEVNQEWAKNAKNRSTHNTYFTLPVIFIMLSNHFPSTYGHEYNWPVLLLITAGGAAIREFFVARIKNPKRSMIFGILGIALLTFVIVFSEYSTKKISLQPETNHHSEITLAPDKNPIKPTTIFDPSKTNLSLSGIITFKGEVPKGKKLNLPAACARQYSGDVFSNELLVKNERVQNVLVRIIKGQESLPPGEIPQTEVILDQKGCIYTPRVTAARVGQKVTFLNSDPIFHNVRSVTNLNEKFNVAMPKKDQKETKVFTKPELFLQAKCSVHPWMGAYIAIMDHQYFSVTNAQGEFKINHLAPGTYTVEIWHEKFGTSTFEITLEDGKNLEKNFELKEIKK
jgi:uncharacterized membrane protein/plastocyanin